MIEYIRLAFRGIITHKLRSFLTMLGVIIGIASIIGIVSIVQGTNAKLEKSLIGSGNNVTTVALTQNGTDEYSFDSNSVPFGFPVVSDEAMDRIRNLIGVVNAATYRQRSIYSAGVYYGNFTLNDGKVLGVSKDFLPTVQYKIVDGRDFTDEEITSGKKVAIIDSGARDALFEGENPIGKILEIKSEPFVIVGVAKNSNEEAVEYKSLEEYQTSAMNANNANIYIPENCWPILFQYDEPQNVAIHVDKTRYIASIGKSASNILNSYTNTGDISYASLSAQQEENQMEDLTNSIRLMLIGIASLSLLVGGIGVMNIMLVSVTERTAEIGLKKALGAKHRTILFQFLTESAVLTSIGGIIGVLVGIGLAAVISYANALEFGVPIPWIVVAVLFSVFIGVLFGAMPAYRAAKLNPIDALRRE
ncbi:MAG: ABC transporter permease [Ruminococcus sp.]|nr:ABC transporter permease [Ruminococcus sp.]